MAERIAHTVKGVAGNIGIESVFTAADKLERAIRERSSGIGSSVAEFAHSLASEIQKIRRGIERKFHQPACEGEKSRDFRFASSIRSTRASEGFAGGQRWRCD